MAIMNEIIIHCNTIQYIYKYEAWTKIAISKFNRQPDGNEKEIFNTPLIEEKEGVAVINLRIII